MDLVQVAQAWGLPPHALLRAGSKEVTMEDAYAIVRRVERAEQTSRIVGDAEGLREAYIAAARELGQQIADAKQALRDLATLRQHRCDWNDEDYCNVCGADGRA